MDFRASAKFTPVEASRLQALFVPRIVDAVTEACGAVVEEARTYCPVDSGDLVSNIGIGSVELVGTVVQGTVTATSGHAAFVEYGTGVRGEGTYPGELPEENVPFTGSWVYDYKQQDWQGHQAQPFMRPALDSAQPAIRDAFAKQGFKV